MCPVTHASLSRQPDPVSRGHQGSLTCGSVNLVKKGTAVMVGETLFPLLLNINSVRRWTGPVPFVGGVLCLGDGGPWVAVDACVRAPVLLLSLN